MRRLCQLEVVCDDNARARFLGVDLMDDRSVLLSLPAESADWGQEDIGEAVYQRWLKPIPTAQRKYVKKCVFRFGDGSSFCWDTYTTHTISYFNPEISLGGFSVGGGEPPTATDELRRFVGNGFIYSVHFYEEAPQDEYDSPIQVKFAIELSGNLERNVQTGVFFYTDAEWEHCVAVNELHFKPHEFAHLPNEPAKVTTIRLSTEHGPITGIVAGTVDAGCLLALDLQ